MIEELKVKEEFNRRASIHKDNNAVLDSSTKEGVKFSNIFRDYITKKGFLETIKLHKNDNVLDFGCGVGRLSKLISENVKHVVGLDISEKMIEVANEINTANNISYSVYTNETINTFEKNSFNTIFSYWVFQHINDSTLLELLEQFNQILVSDGRIYIYEQIQNKVSVSGDLHIMRKENEYIDLFNQKGFKLQSTKKLFRMPSYGMSLFNKIGINNALILRFCGFIDSLLINRKPEFMDYYTCCMEFVKK